MTKTKSQTPTPVNFSTGREYKGDNAIRLQTAAIDKGFTSPIWSTMKQWNAGKGSIAKGEKGTTITYSRMFETEDGPVEVMEIAFVFNKDQLAKLTAN